MMRAKMVVNYVTSLADAEKKVTQETIKFSAVSKNEGYPDDGLDENNTFATFTPSAQLEMSITNPALLGKMAPGDTFYVDFTKVETQDVNKD